VLSQHNFLSAWDVWPCRCNVLISVLMRSMLSLSAWEQDWWS